MFANSVKRDICDVKNSRLGYDLPRSINDRMISTFRKDFILRKIKLSRKFRNLQYFYLIMLVYNTPLTAAIHLYLRNKETQQTLQVIVSIQYDARF